MEIKTVAIVGMGALGLLYGEAIAKACGNKAVRFVMDEKRYNRYKSEMELFAGTILRLVKNHNISAPVNQQYYDKIKEIEAGY